VYRNVGIAIHPAQELPCRAAGMIQHLDARVGVLVELSSSSFLVRVRQESVPLFARKKLKEGYD
jgi:hypothetical protein